MTPLLRVLAPIPTRGIASSTNTSSHRAESARAIAHPTTPPPMMTAFALSILQLSWKLLTAAGNFANAKCARRTFLAVKTLNLLTTVTCPQNAFRRVPFGGSPLLQQGELDFTPAKRHSILKWASAHAFHFGIIPIVPSHRSTNSGHPVIGNSVRRSPKACPPCAYKCISTGPPAFFSAM